MKKSVEPAFQSQKVAKSRAWNKILYVTRDNSRFFSWVVTAFASLGHLHPRKKSCRSGSKPTRGKNLLLSAPCYIMYNFKFYFIIFYTVIFFLFYHKYVFFH